MLFSSFLLPFSVLAADDDGYTPQWLTGHLDFRSGEGTSVSGSADGVKCYIYFTDGSTDWNGYYSVSSGRIMPSNSSWASKSVNKIVFIPTQYWYHLAKGSRYGLLLNVQYNYKDVNKSFSFFNSSWASPFETLGSTSSSLIIVPSSDIPLSGSFFQLFLNGSYVLSTLTLNFFSVQLMPGLYAAGEEQAIIDKLEEGQQEQQQQHQETKGLLGSIIDGILSLPQTIIDLLSDLIKFLFVPDDTFIQDWVDDLQTWFETKFGVLALPFTLMTTLIGAFSSAGSGDVSLVFPSFSIMGYEVWGNQSVDMATILQPFSILITSIRTVLGILLIGAFIKYLQTLYDKVLGVGT